MTQSRIQSAIETVIQTAIGFVVACATQIVVFPWFGLKTTFYDDLAIAAIFTAVSLIRGYFVRRFFNWHHRNG